MEQGTWSTT